MGQVITVREQRYFNEFKNGENFTDDLTDFTNNFTGSVMEKQKVRFVLDVSWGFNSSTSNTISSTTSGGVISKASGSFLDDGFSVGDSVDMNYTNDNGNPVVRFTIDSISNNVMYVTATSGTIPNSTDNGFVNSTVRLVGITPLTALVWKFGLIENSSNFSSQNIITNSDQAYYVSGINFTGNAWFTMQSVGTNRDWVTGTIRVRPVATGLYGIQRFEVEHQIIIPFFSEGDDFVTKPTYLDGLNSLKYSFDAGFRTVLSNPDSEKNFVYDTSSGSVGYYDENYNGFNNDYSIVSTNYQESTTLNNASGLLATGRTKVTVTISTSGTAFVNSGRYGVYVGYQANQSDYTNTTSDFKSNFIYDRELGLINLTTSNGHVFIYSVNSTIVNSQLVITFEVEYTASQKLFLSNKLSSGTARYIIGVSIGDNTLSNGNSNRVMLLADNGAYDHNADIPNLIQNTSMNLFTYKDVIGVDSGFTSIEQWNEDGFIAKGSFDLNIDRGALMNSLQFRLIAHNPTTGNFFTLDTYTFNILSSPVVSGVQQINLVNDRGYSLASGNVFNSATLTTSSNPISNGLKTFDFQIGQKISWQEWISNNNVDNIFYNSSEPNNNLNNKSSNYSLKQGYEIKFAIFSNVFGRDDQNVSGATDYLIASPSLEINDYDQDGNNTPLWSGVITTINPSNNTSLQGAILTGGSDTLFRITWSNISGPVTDVSNISIIHRIEESFQNGYDIDENGDTRPNPSNNRLINKTGFTQIHVYTSAGNVISECLIKGSELTAGTQYNLSGKIINTNALLPKGKLTSPLSQLKDTSGTVENKLMS